MVEASPPKLISRIHKAIGRKWEVVSRQWHRDLKNLLGKKRLEKELKTDGK